MNWISINEQTPDDSILNDLLVTDGKRIEVATYSLWHDLFETKLFATKVSWTHWIRIKNIPIKECELCQNRHRSNHVLSSS